jgi:adenine-specific DNA-methyltransferase
MADLTTIQNWKILLGLLPIKLMSTNPAANKYILLNGGTGDFCLQLNENIEDDEFYYSSAWSSNTKNFVTYTNDNTFVYNWKKGNKETVRTSLVSENFLKFYDYIIANSFTTERDITPYIVNIFRKIRNLVNDRKDGVESLKLLFYLMASLETDLN